MGMGAEKMALLGRHASAFAVGDAFGGFQSRFFTGHGHAGCFLAADCPGVKQIEVSDIGFNVFWVGQTSRGVFGGESRDVKRSLHRLMDGAGGEVRGAGIASALAHIHRHTQGLVAVAFHIFELSLAHTDRQAAAFRGFSARIGSADFFGVLQSGIDQVFKKIAAVTEAAVRRMGRLGDGGRGRIRCHWRCAHGDGYDTCRHAH